VSEFVAAAYERDELVHQLSLMDPKRTAPTCRTPGRARQSARGHQPAPATGLRI